MILLLLVVAVGGSYLKRGLFEEGDDFFRLVQPRIESAQDGLSPDGLSELADGDDDWVDSLSDLWPSAYVAPRGYGAADKEESEYVDGDESWTFFPWEDRAALKVRYLVSVDPRGPADRWPNNLGLQAFLAQLYPLILLVEQSGLVWPLEPIGISYDETVAALAEISHRLLELPDFLPATGVAGVFAKWHSALLVMMAARYNDPSISGEPLDVFRHQIDSFRLLARLLGRETFKDFAIADHQLSSFLKFVAAAENERRGRFFKAGAGLLEWARSLANEIATFRTNPHLLNLSLKLRMMEFLIDFLDEGGVAQPEVCSVIGTEILEAAAILLKSDSPSPSVDYDRLLVGDFVRICSHHAIEFDSVQLDAVLLRFRVLAHPVHTFAPAGIRARQLAEDPAAGLRSTFASLRRKTKIDFLHPSSPEVTFRGSPARGDGPRIAWVSTSLRASLESGLFIFPSETENMLKPAPLPGVAATARSRLFAYVSVGRLIGLGLKLDLTLSLGLTPACLHWLLHPFTPMTAWQQAEFWEVEDPLGKLNIENLASGVGFAAGMPFPSKNGRNGKRKLSDENVEAFVEQTRQWLMVDSVRPQMLAILAGVNDVLPFGWFAHMSPSQLDSTLRGTSFIDLPLLEATTTYDPALRMQERMWLWEILGAYDQDELGKFLEFLSGSPRPPLRGFAGVRNFKNELGKWMLVSVAAGVDRLPGSQTCFKQLLLPKYSNIETMKARLDYAIEHGFTVDNY